MTDSPLPERSDSQRIGHRAEKCFRANCPDEWIPGDLAGTDDFGFDFQVQTTIDNKVTGIFRVQLKGTETPGFNATREFLSVTIKASTAGLYARTTEPILLLVADLSANSRAADCPIYYVWIHDELRRRNAEDLLCGQEYLTFRVPVGNRLTEVTDLTADLERFRTLAKIGESLDAVAEQRHPGLPPIARANLIEKLPNAIARRSSTLLQAIVEESESPWPAAPYGSLQWFLNETSQSLQVGDLEDADEALRNAEMLLSAATQSEKAELWFLRGRLRAACLDHVGARDCYASAASISSDAPRHVAAWAEAELRLRSDSLDAPELSDVISRLCGNDPLVKGVRARMLAVQGNYAEALNLAKETDGSPGKAALAVIHSMKSEFQSAREACEEGLSASPLRASEKQMFLVLRARALFMIAVGNVASQPGYVIPASGPAGVDTDVLKQAWEAIQEALDELRASGWPPNIEVIADIWGATASMMGLQEQVLPVMAAAASMRTGFTQLQVALEAIAAQCDEFGLALTANGRQPKSDAQVLHRVALLHMDRRDYECVSLFELEGTKCDRSEAHYSAAVSMAILSADRIVRSDSIALWKPLLEESEGDGVHAALLDYFLSVGRNRLGKDVFLGSLYRRYEELGRPLNLATHIFHEFDASDKEQSAKCIDVAHRIMEEQLLHQEAMVHLAQALATERRWEELYSLAREGLRRFSRNDRFVAIEAVALDRMGRSAEALASLRTLVLTGTSDRFAVNSYINIVTRCGYSEEAIHSVEQIVSSETDRERVIEALRLLFVLVHHSDPFDSRSVDIAWRLGELVRQDDEGQEGLFLTLFFAGTTFAHISPDDARIPVFQKRLRDFTERFPQSSILKAVKIPEGEGADGILRMIKEVTGIDEEVVRARKTLERQLKSGELPLPYVWRPRRVLMNVSDLAVLWQLGKNSRSHERELHLTMLANDMAVGDSVESGTIPLLDLTTLLVVNDLALFDRIFEVFPVVAIAQGTLSEIARCMAPLSGSPVRSIYGELQANLKRRFAQIEQPWADPDEDADVSDTGFIWASEEVKKIVREGRYRLYSDDAAFRVYCDIPSSAPPSMCTLDLLGELERRGVLSVRDVSQLYSRLCSWHVGLVVDLRHQVAAIPEGLAHTRTVSQGIEFLRSDPIFAAMFDEIWDPRQPYSKLRSHGAAILHAFVKEKANRIESVASVLGVWMGKVRLHKDAPAKHLVCVAEIVLLAAAHIGPDSIEVGRLWAVYRQLVEVWHGERMDEEKERQAIGLVGEMAGSLERKIKRQVGTASLFETLKSGLIAGTSDAAAFDGGYDRILRELVEQARKGKQS